MFLIFFLLVIYGNTVNGSIAELITQLKTAVTSAISQTPEADRPVHLTINCVSNENVQTNTIDIREYPRQLFATGKEQFNYGVTALWNYIKQNKKKVFINCLALSCVSLQIRLWHLKIKLGKIKCWSQSQSNKKLEDIYQIPQNTLSEQLLGQIQKIYMQLDNPTGFSQPITLFIKDIEKEQKILEEYNRIVNWAHRLYLRPVLFYDKDLVAEIPDRLHRIIYFKNCFLNWLAELKAARPADFMHKAS